MTEKPSRYQPPPGSEFFLSTDESGERSGFCIFAPDGDRFSIVGPDGTGKSAEVFNRRPVSESDFWAAVAAEESRFKPPPGAEFVLSTDEDGEKSVFEIWVDVDEPGYRKVLGPDGRKGRMGFNGRWVSESEFWAAVAAAKAEKQSGSPPP